MLAIGIDPIYQATVLDRFRSGEAVFLGIVVAIVPSLIFRGVVKPDSPSKTRRSAGDDIVRLSR